MSKFSKPDNLNGEHVHLIGIGGCGMNAVAQLLLAQGSRVTGSDRLLDQKTTTPTLAKLEKHGIRMFPQDGSGIDSSTNAVVYSTAVEADNPDMEAAMDNEVEMYHRSEILAKLLDDKQLIAIGGTSGKTTTTGMLGWVFEQLKLDPTVVNGAPLVDWTNPERIGNVRIGESNIAIIEADESDQSILKFRPSWSTITNISQDHFDLEETLEIFSEFSRQTSETIICGPTVPLDKLGSDNIYQANFEAKQTRSFRYRGVDFSIQLPGQHNLENALVAVVLCDRYGLDLAEVADALENFKGIERRLQRIGGQNGIEVFDDYAHNPAKIKAAWTTLTPTSERILGIWRPHGFKPLHTMRHELCKVFKEVMRIYDKLYILPVYYSGGTATCQTTASQFVDLLREKGVNACFVPDYPTLAQMVGQEASSGDTILCMGARDPQLPRFAKEINLICSTDLDLLKVKQAFRLSGIAPPSA